MPEPDRLGVAVRTAAVLAFVVAVIVVGRLLLITDAWPGGWRWWFVVSALAVAIVLAVAARRDRRGRGPT